MAVTVRLPSMLHVHAGPEVVVEAPVSDLGSVVHVLQQLHPRLAAALEDPIYNFAINDVLILHGVRQQPVQDGDVIEVVPTISGG